ncbi:MAG: VOC family protein [Rubrivivax sp.]|nr:VOC family protein [Rubrivivax sp.]
MSVAVDHLIVAADSLDQGVRWCEATLGVSPGAGGQHPLMGTHNRLLKIATEAFPEAYLEIIAIDPEAVAPARPRWFGLDNPALQARLRQQPRLIHWVARSSMLDMHRWGLINARRRPGEPVEAGRETPQGPLRWQILITDDGRLDCGGALPTLIEWQGRHPTAAMPGSGVSLQALALRGLPDRARDVLRLRGIDASADAGPALRARLLGPCGEVTLESE